MSQSYIHNVKNNKSATIEADADLGLVLKQTNAAGVATAKVISTTSTSGGDVTAITSATQFDVTAATIGDYKNNTVSDIVLTGGQVIRAGKEYNYDGQSWAIINEPKIKNIGKRTTIVKDLFPTNGALSNGWLDVAGSTWSVIANRLTGTTSDTAGYFTKFCLRPISENVLNQEIIAQQLFNINTQASLFTVLRKQVNGNNYAAKINPTGSVEMFKFVGGSFSNLVTANNNVIPNFNPFHKYTLDFAAVGAFPTILKLKIINSTIGETVVDIAREDNEASLQVPGQAGFSVQNNGNNTASVDFVRVVDLGLTKNLVNVIFVGDSITKGEQTSNPDDLLTIGGGVYPGYFAKKLGYYVVGKNLGFGGRRADQFVTDAITQAPQYYKPSIDQNIVIVKAGANDLIQQTSSGYEIGNLIKTICLTWRKNGFKVIVATILPGSQITPGLYDPQRNELNEYIRANWPEFADGIADLGSNELMGYDGAEKNTTYFSPDQVHLTNAGYKVVGGVTGNAALNLLGNTGNFNDNPTKVDLSISKYDIALTIPTTQNAYRDIGQFVSPAGGHNIIVNIVGETGNGSFAKTYNVSCGYGESLGLWKVMPHTTGRDIDNGNDIELLLLGGGGLLQLRVRKTATSFSSAVGNMKVTVINIGSNGETWTPLTTSGTDAATYDFFGQSINPDIISKPFIITDTLALPSTTNIYAPITSFTAFVNKISNNPTFLVLPNPDDPVGFKNTFTFIVKDVKGDAGTNNITLGVTGFGVTIESFTTPGTYGVQAVINTNSAVAKYVFVKIGTTRKWVKI
jgi:lysophospholipase L1-like esterase